MYARKSWKLGPVAALDGFSGIIFTVLRLVLSLGQSSGIASHATQRQIHRRNINGLVAYMPTNVKKNTKCEKS